VKDGTNVVVVSARIYDNFYKNTPSPVHLTFALIHYTVEDDPIQRDSCNRYQYLWDEYSCLNY
jgi:hypothetical protein